MMTRALLCAWLALGAAAPMAGSRAATSAPTGWQPDVRFNDYTPLSRGSEIARRLFTPLTNQRLQQYLASRAQVMREQSIDLTQEHFAVYVPTDAPPKQGYGLLVFVPPWPDAKLPNGWARELDRHGLVYVSAANAGNSADVIDRRVPLALLALANIRKRYPIDPDRIYVGGFSGGARVALRIALGYPDVFRGVLLDAGSDRLGKPSLSLPPAELFHQFQQNTRVVYLTGAQDAVHLQMDAESRQSLKQWCVFNTTAVTVPGLDHEIADPAALARALDALAQPTTVDAQQLISCREHNDKTLATALAEVQAALAHDDRKRAQEKLGAFDARYGGLAATELLKLQAGLVVPSP